MAGSPEREETRAMEWDGSNVWSSDVQNSQRHVRSKTTNFFALTMPTELGEYELGLFWRGTP